MSCKKACSCICTSSDMKSLEQLNQRLVNLESGERFQESSLRDRRDWVFCMHFLLYQCILHGEPNFRGTALRIFFLGGRRGGNDTHELCFSGILLTSFRHSYFYQKAIKILHYMLCCQWIFKKEKKKKAILMNRSLEKQFHYALCCERPVLKSAVTYGLISVCCRKWVCEHSL